MPISFEQPQPLDLDASQRLGLAEAYRSGMNNGGGGGGGGGGQGGYAPGGGSGSSGVSGDFGGEYGDSHDYGAHADAQLALNSGTLTQAENMRLQRQQMGLNSVQEQLEAGEIDEDMAADLAFEIKNNMAPLQKRVIESQNQLRATQSEENTKRAAQIQAQTTMNAAFQAGELQKQVKTVTFPDGSTANYLIGPDGKPIQVNSVNQNQVRQQQQETHRQEFIAKHVGEIETAVRHELQEARRNDPGNPDALPSWVNVRPPLTVQESINQSTDAEVQRRLGVRMRAAGMQPPGQQGGGNNGQGSGGNSSATPNDERTIIQQGGQQLAQSLERQSAQDPYSEALTYDLRQALADPSTPPAKIKDLINEMPVNLLSAISIPRSYANAIMNAANRTQNQTRDDSNITGTPNPNPVAGAEEQRQARVAESRGPVHRALGLPGSSNFVEDVNALNESAGQPSHLSGDNPAIQEIHDIAKDLYNNASVGRMFGATHAAGELADLLRGPIERGTPMTRLGMEHFNRIMQTIRRSNPALATRLTGILTGAGFDQNGMRRRQQ